MKKEIVTDILEEFKIEEELIEEYLQIEKEYLNSFQKIDKYFMDLIRELIEEFKTKPTGTREEYIEVMKSYRKRCPNSVTRCFISDSIREFEKINKGK